MNKKFFLSALLALSLIFSFALPVFAQDYSFQVPEVQVDLFIESDGTAAIQYYFHFQNSAGAHAIDFVDVGMPGSSTYSLSNVTANVDGKPITDIQKSPYVDGIALGLGSNEIPAGGSGVVYMYIDKVTGIFYKAASQNGQEYASVQFQPNYFDSSLSSGSTNMTVNIHLPPGAKDGEVVYYTPKGWPGSDTPASGIDNEGRITYQWSSPNAKPSGVYTFGAAFSASLIPAGAIRSEQTVTFNPSKLMGSLVPIFCCGGFAAIFGLVIYLSVKSARKRKLKYLPPKIAIEGHGIKRGLTAVEAGILMEEPMDKILTMILFSVLRKDAATVTSRDPLEIKVEDKLPEGLRDYETAFLMAFKGDKTKRRKALQDMMVSLVKTVQEKMKGFSRKETVDYYKSIMEQAWQQVESAKTPEVRAEKYSDAVDWTMLDKDYDTRTRRVFGPGPVFMPIWWYRADPSIGRTTTTAGGLGGAVKSAPSLPSGGKSTTITLPSLPGAAAAASVVNSVTAFSSGVVGNVSSFTGAVTNQTNPLPKPTSSTFHSSGGRGGGGFSGGCACACACAGCACACAGGGR